MPELDYKVILQNIESGKPAPLYWLQGEESYFLDLVSDCLENKVLTPDEAGFNLTVFYGKDTPATHVLESARRFPMMAQRQVVLVKEAQMLDSLDKLEAYFRQPVPTTVLAFVHKGGTLDKRKKTWSLLKDNAVVLTTKKLYENQVPQWISGFMGEKDRTISPKATRLITDFIGNDLQQIANELEKLLLNVPPGKTIDDADVERNIGISREYNVFELQEALNEKNVEKAFRIALNMNANEKNNPFVQLTSSLFNHFQKVFIVHHRKNADEKELAAILKVNPFFVGKYRLAARNYPPPKVREIMQTIQDYDLRFKGVNDPGTSQGELLRELLFKILN